MYFVLFVSLVLFSAINCVSERDFREKTGYDSASGLLEVDEKSQCSVYYGSYKEISVKKSSKNKDTSKKKGSSEKKTTGPIYPQAKGGKVYSGVVTIVQKSAKRTVDTEICCEYDEKTSPKTLSYNQTATDAVKIKSCCVRRIGSPCHQSGLRACPEYGCFVKSIDQRTNSLDYSLGGYYQTTGIIYRELSGYIVETKIISYRNEAKCADKRRSIHIESVNSETKNGNSFISRIKNRQILYHMCCSVDVTTNLAARHGSSCCGLSGSPAPYYHEEVPETFLEWPECCRREAGLIETSDERVRSGPGLSDGLNLKRFGAKRPILVCLAGSGHWRRTKEFRVPLPARAPRFYFQLVDQKATPHEYNPAMAPYDKLYKCIPRDKTQESFGFAFEVFSSVNIAYFQHYRQVVCCKNKEIFFEDPKTIDENCCITLVDGIKEKQVNERAHLSICRPESLGRDYFLAYYKPCYQSACYKEPAHHLNPAYNVTLEEVAKFSNLGTFPEGVYGVYDFYKLTFFDSFNFNPPPRKPGTTSPRPTSPQPTSQAPTSPRPTSQRPTSQAPTSPRSTSKPEPSTATTSSTRPPTSTPSREVLTLKNTSCTLYFTALNFQNANNKKYPEPVKGLVYTGAKAELCCKFDKGYEGTISYKKYSENANANCCVRKKGSLCYSRGARACPTFGCSVNLKQESNEVQSRFLYCGGSEIDTQGKIVETGLITFTDTNLCKDQNKQFHVQMVRSPENRLVEGFVTRYHVNQHHYIFHMCCSHDVTTDLTRHPRDVCCGSSGNPAPYFNAQAGITSTFVEWPKCCGKQSDGTAGGTQSTCDPVNMRDLGAKHSIQVCSPLAGLWKDSVLIDNFVPYLSPQYFYQKVDPKSQSTFNPSGPDHMNQYNCESKLDLTGGTFAFTFDNIQTIRAGRPQNVVICCKPHSPFFEPTEVEMICCISYVKGAKEATGQNLDTYECSLQIGPNGMPKTFISQYKYIYKACSRERDSCIHSGGSDGSIGKLNPNYTVETKKDARRKLDNGDTLGTYGIDDFFKNKRFFKSTGQP